MIPNVYLVVVALLVAAFTLDHCAYQRGVDDTKAAQAAAQAEKTEAVVETQADLGAAADAITEDTRTRTAATEQAVHEAMNVIENLPDFDDRLAVFRAAERSLRDEAAADYAAAAEVYFAVLGDGADAPAGAA